MLKGELRCSTQVQCRICDEIFLSTSSGKAQKNCLRCRRFDRHFSLPSARYLTKLENEKRPWFCERCGKDLSDLVFTTRGVARAVVHHKDGDHANDKDGNHELLCSSCHMTGHRREEKFVNGFNKVVRGQPQSEEHRKNRSIAITEWHRKRREAGLE